MYKAVTRRNNTKGKWYTVKGCELGRDTKFTVYGDNRQDVLRYLVYDTIFRSIETDGIITVLDSRFTSIDEQEITKEEVLAVNETLRDFKGVEKEVLQLMALDMFL